ncbi:MAG: hypothetical protein K0S33_2823 [Bacteroidetes bacterium]|nr:hypothetical protein [Bacteroidota bacterium]
MLIKEIEIEEAIIGLREDGIGHVYLKSGTEVNVRLQEILMEHLLLITEGKPHDFIFEAGEHVSLTKEAREHANHYEGRTPVRSIVTVVNNLGYRLVAEFYHRVHKPNKPFKAVSSFQDGLNWLRPHRMHIREQPSNQVSAEETKEELNNQPY